MRTRQPLPSFYRKIHDEVMRACNTGSLSCSHSLVPFMPQISGDDVHALPSAIRLLLRRLLFIDPPWTENGVSWGSTEEIQQESAFLNVPDSISCRWSCPCGPQYFPYRGGVPGENNCRESLFALRSNPDHCGISGILAQFRDCCEAADLYTRIGNRMYSLGDHRPPSPGARIDRCFLFPRHLQSVSLACLPAQLFCLVDLAFYVRGSCID